MGTGHKFRRKPLTRPTKNASSRRRREQVHRRRLVALGVSAEKVAELDSRQLRELLKRPAALAGRG